MSVGSFSGGISSDGVFSLDWLLDRNARESIKRFLSAYYNQLSVTDQVSAAADNEMLGKMRGSDCPIESLNLSVGQCEDRVLGSKVVCSPWPDGGISNLDLSLVTDGFRLVFKEFKLETSKDDEKKQIFHCKIQPSESIMDLLDLFSGQGWHENLITEWKVFNDLELKKGVVSSLNTFYKNRNLSLDFSIADLCLQEIARGGISYPDPEKLFLTILESSWCWLSTAQTKKAYCETLNAARLASQRPAGAGGKDVSQSVSSYAFDRSGKIALMGGPLAASPPPIRSSLPHHYRSDPGPGPGQGKPTMTHHQTPYHRGGTPTGRTQHHHPGRPGTDPRHAVGRGQLLQQMRGGSAAGGRQAGSGKSLLERFLEADWQTRKEAKSGKRQSPPPATTPPSRPEIPQPHAEIKDQSPIVAAVPSIQQDGPRMFGGVGAAGVPSYSSLASGQIYTIGGADRLQSGDLFPFQPGPASPAQPSQPVHSTPQPGLGGGWRGGVDESVEQISDNFESCLDSPAAADELIERIKKAPAAERLCWGQTGFAGNQKLDQEEIFEIMMAFSINPEQPLHRIYFIALDKLQEVHGSAGCDTFIEQFFSHVVLILARLVLNEAYGKAWDDPVPNLDELVKPGGELTQILKMRMEKEKEIQRENEAREAAALAQEQSMFEMPPGTEPGFRANVEDLLASMTIHGENEEEKKFEFGQRGSRSPTKSDSDESSSGWSTADTRKSPARSGRSGPPVDPPADLTGQGGPAGAGGLPQEAVSQASDMSGGGSLTGSVAGLSSSDPGLASGGGAAARGESDRDVRAAARAILESRLESSTASLRQVLTRRGAAAAQLSRSQGGPLVVENLSGLNHMADILRSKKKANKK